MLHLACGLITWRATNWEPLSESALSWDDGARCPQPRFC